MSGDPADQGPLGAATHRDLVAALLREAAAAGITELEVGYGDLRLFVRRRPGLQLGHVAPAIASGPAEAPAVHEDWEPVITPLAGVYYAQESPDVEPYVHVGSVVSPGQTVGLVEAMKTFNTVLCDIGGIVRQIVVGAGETVQPGQILMYVEPDDGLSAGPPVL